VTRIASALLAAAIAATLSASAATAALGTARHNGKTVTLHLVTKEVGGNFIDNSPRQGFNSPPLIGDQFSFTSEVLTRSGKRAGSFAATCVFARGGVKSLVLCHGFYSLKGGQIFGMAKGTEGATTEIAIVGGTGAYAGVSGTATEVSRSENSPFTDVTVRLLYP
jgi:hypothetical protein